VIRATSPPWEALSSIEEYEAVVAAEELEMGEGMAGG